MVAKPLAVVRGVPDEIRDRVQILLDELLPDRERS